MDRNAGYTPSLLAIYPLRVGLHGARRVALSDTSDRGPVPSPRRRRHLEVGPGTGYFLDAVGVDGGTDVTLLDPNPNVLAKTSRHLRHLAPATVEADVLKPLPVHCAFDSLAMNYVLHCLPGPLARKETAVQNMAAVTAPEGDLFGGTVLGREERHLRWARAVLWAGNQQGGFDNRTDTVAGLRDILDRAFGQVEIDVMGSIAHFVARRPRTVNPR